MFFQEWNYFLYQTKPFFFSRQDTEAELEIVRSAAITNGAFDAVRCTHYAEGGKGAEKLADALVKVCSSEKSKFRFLYDLNKSIEEKVKIIAQQTYGAGDVEFSAMVLEKIQSFNAQVSFWIDS